MRRSPLNNYCRSTFFWPIAPAIVSVLWCVILNFPSASAQVVEPTSNASSLLVEGHLLVSRGNLREGYDLFKEAWNVAQLECDDSPQDLLNLSIIQNVLGDTAMRLGRMADAIQHQRDALALKERAFPKNRLAAGHEQLVIGHRNLASSLVLAGYSKERLDQNKVAVEMANNLVRIGKCDPSLPANCLLRFSESLRDASELQDAFEQAIVALNMLKQLFPKGEFPDGHDAIAASYLTVGSVLMEAGDYEQALTYFDQASKMISTLYSQSLNQLTSVGMQAHINVTTYLFNVHRLLGDLALARENVEKSLEVSRRLYIDTDGHPNLVSILMDYSLVLLQLGETERARAALREVDEMLPGLFPIADFPDGHPLIATYYSRVADHKKSLGKLDDALNDELHGVAILRELAKNGGSQNGLAIALNGLGRTYFERADYENAENVFSECLSIYRGLFPTEKYPLGHPSLVMALANCGGAMLWRKRLDDAKHMVEMAKSMNDRLYPPDNYPHGSENSNGLYNLLASVAIERGETKLAIDWMIKEHHIRNEQAKLNFVGLSTSESLNFVDASDLRMPGLLISAIDDFGSLEEITSAYEVILRRRAFVHRFARMRNELANTTTESDKLLSDYKGVVRILSRRSRQPIDVDHREAFLEQSKLWQKERDRLEADIGRKLPDYLAQFDANEIGIESIQTNMPSDSVLIDIVQYMAYQDANFRQAPELSYGAFVASKRQSQFIFIGRADPIDSAIGETLDKISSLQPVSESLEKLRLLLLEPLRPVLQEKVKHLFICPDGEIAKVPWTALPDGSGKPILESYSITAIPHADSLVRASYKPYNNEVKDGIIGKLLYVGDLDYGEPYKPYGPLPGTKYDSKMFGAKLDIDVITLIGREKQITGGKVLEELGNVKIAHIGTHGFSGEGKPLSQPRVNEFERLDGDFTRIVDADIIMRNPYVGAGIALSNANLVDGNDTFLTGDDIAANAFPSLRLVFLAICDSSKGRSVAGEGVFGLQRAFHATGAETVVASSWKADDLSTEFITAKFYMLLRQGWGPTEALRQAQQAVAGGELSEDARHPFFWASWSVSGDPGPLSK